MSEDGKELGRWRVLSSEYLAREPWFTVRKESIVSPRGARVPSYYVLEYPEWVNVLALTGDGQVVMIRQYRHGLGEVGWEIPAGVCDPTDSSPLDAARRELLEETGYGGGEWQQWMTLSANPSTHSNLTQCFLARNVERLGDPSPEATEEIEVVPMTREQVMALLEQDAIKQSLMAAPLWKYFALEKK